MQQNYKLKHFLLYNFQQSSAIYLNLFFKLNFMNSKDTEEQKNNYNAPKTTRFITTPQVYEYENSKDYDNQQQYLLDDLISPKQKPIATSQKLVFTTKIVEQKPHMAIQTNHKAFNEKMQMERPQNNNVKLNFGSNFVNANQNNIPPQIAELDQEFERIQKLTQQRQEQNHKRHSPQKALVGAIKEKQYKRFSERGINLQSFLTIAPQVQKKSGRKTFDVQEITAIKNKADKMTDEIGNNKKIQQSKNVKFNEALDQQQKEHAQIKSQEIQQKIDFAKKKKQRLTMNMFEIMGMMEKVDQKLTKSQSYKHEKKKRQNRLTINLDSITKMFQNDNFLNPKQEQDRLRSNVPNPGTILEDPQQDKQSSRKKDKYMEKLSQQQMNRVFADKYFSEVDLRIQNLRRQNSQLQQLKQNLLRQKKLSEQGHKINPENFESNKRINEQYISQTKLLKQKTTQEKYIQSLKVIDSFNFRLQMKIYKFQIDTQNDQNGLQTFFSKFKIGSHLVKIRRTKENQQIQVRIKTLVVPSVHQAQTIFEASTLFQLLYNFISKKLNQTKTLLQVLLAISNFYQKLKELQTQLEQLMEILNLSEFQLSTTAQQLTFRYQLNSKDVYLLEIKLLNILQDKSVNNYVTIYSRRKREYVQLPRNYRPFKDYHLYNQIDFIQQSFSVFDN